MKKNLSLCMAVSLMLSIPEQVLAVTFKERAESIRQKAIAVAKKGGKYSKQLWDKINFMGRAIKEKKAADEAFKKCRMMSCEAELKEFKEADGLRRMARLDELEGRYSMRPYVRSYDEVFTRYEKARASLDKCDLLHCRYELKQFNKARDKEVETGAVLATLIGGAAGAAGAALGIAVIQDRQLEKEELEKELAKRQLEKEEIEKELEKTKSPIYEAPGQ